MPACPLLLCLPLHRAIGGGHGGTGLCLTLAPWSLVADARVSEPLGACCVEWVCTWADGDGHARVEWLQDSDLHLKAILARYHDGYYKTGHEMRLHVIQLWRNWSPSRLACACCLACAHVCRAAGRHVCWQVRVCELACRSGTARTRICNVLCKTHHSHTHLPAHMPTSSATDAGHMCAQDTCARKGASDSRCLRSACFCMAVARAAPAHVHAPA